MLEGLLLDNKWTVGALISKTIKDTGGNFSQSYVATDAQGNRVFVKALDFSRAFGAGGNITQVLQHVTESFNYEVGMLEFCATKGMDRVVRAISSGTVIIDTTPLGQVPYLVFEAADRDVRKHLDFSSNLTDVEWKLRVLHHISTGLKQLHGSDIVHQDLKPSNVLMFDGLTTKGVSKLADLGRASRSGLYCPFDTLDWAGDPAYASPEAMYGYIDVDWHRRRIGYDIYLLGSLCSFLFLRTTSNAALIAHLPLQFHPGNWNGTFDDVVTYLQDAFASATESFASQLSPQLREDLIPVYKMLCDPDPRRRGFPGQSLNRVALERFITKFDVMARKASIGRYN
jgi:serine/threonine protein kinase